MPDTPSPPGDREAHLHTLQAVCEISERAEAGDPQALKEAHALLRDWPDFAVLALQADHALLNRHALAARLSDSNPARTSATLEYAESLRNDLAGPECGPIERLLIENILHLWLAVLELDRERDRAAAEPTAWADHRDRIRDRAHRRLHAALKTLAQVRKLGVPAIQVNIADQQVNVAG